jgi:hypothetical protein
MIFNKSAIAMASAAIVGASAEVVEKNTNTGFHASFPKDTILSAPIDCGEKFELLSEADRAEKNTNTGFHASFPKDTILSAPIDCEKFELLSEADRATCSRQPQESRMVFGRVVENQNAEKSCQKPMLELVIPQNLFSSGKPRVWKAEAETNMWNSSLKFIYENEEEAAAQAVAENKAAEEGKNADDKAEETRLSWYEYLLSWVGKKTQTEEVGKPVVEKKSEEKKIVEITLDWLAGATNNDMGANYKFSAEENDHVAVPADEKKKDQTEDAKVFPPFHSRWADLKSGARVLVFKGNRLLTCTAVATAEPLKTLRWFEANSLPAAQKNMLFFDSNGSKVFKALTKAVADAELPVGEYNGIPDLKFAEYGENRVLKVFGPGGRKTASTVHFTYPTYSADGVKSEKRVVMRWGVAEKLNENWETENELQICEVTPSKDNKGAWDEATRIAGPLYGPLANDDAPVVGEDVRVPDYKKFSEFIQTLKKVEPEEKKEEDGTVPEENGINPYVAALLVVLIVGLLGGCSFVAFRKWKQSKEAAAEESS